MTQTKQYKKRETKKKERKDKGHPLVDWRIKIKNMLGQCLIAKKISIWVLESGGSRKYLYCVKGKHMPATCECPVIIYSKPKNELL